MTTGVRYSAYGVTLTLDGNDPAIIGAAGHQIGPFGWQPDAGGADHQADLGYVLRRQQMPKPDGGELFDLECNRSLVHRSRDRGRLIDAFVDHSKLELASRAHGRVFVHAG